MPQLEKVVEQESRDVEVRLDFARAAMPHQYSYMLSDSRSIVVCEEGVESRGELCMRTERELP